MAWVLTEAGVEIAFGEYQIAAYADGLRPRRLNNAAHDGNIVFRPVRPGGLGDGTSTRMRRSK